MLTFIAILTILLYFTACGMQTLRLARHLEGAAVSISILSVCAIILHAFLLHHWIDLPDGQNLTFFNTLSQVLWITAGVVWLMALRRPLVNLGIIVYPLAGISIILVLGFSGDYIIQTSAEPKKLLHILLSFLAIGILLIAAIQACLLTILNQALRKKYSNAITQSLPPLQMMESLLFQLIALGFCILTAVIYTGFMSYPAILQSEVWHHMLFASLAWLIFGILLIGRFFLGWRGKLAIRWTLIGAVLLLIAYIASQF